MVEWMYLDFVLDHFWFHDVVQNITDDNSINNQTNSGEQVIGGDEKQSARNKHDQRTNGRNKRENCGGKTDQKDASYWSEDEKSC